MRQCCSAGSSNGRIWSSSKSFPWPAARTWSPRWPDIFEKNQQAEVNRYAVIVFRDRPDWRVQCTRLALSEPVYCDYTKVSFRVLGRKLTAVVELRPQNIARGISLIIAAALAISIQD